ncbi:MAG: hypothetical protein J6E42_08265 [Firmicutes bacterium]|nr:hypothetical protein [Bacillota bacterium]
MKQLIVLSAVLPLMLVFLLPFTLDQRNAYNISQFQEIVYTAREEARQEGCFTREIESRLKRRVAEAFRISEEEIELEATRTVQYRVQSGEGFDPNGRQRGMIHYKVTVPIQRLMAGHRLFGIKESDNKGKYTVEGYAASERLP